MRLEDGGDGGGGGEVGFEIAVFETGDAAAGAYPEAAVAAGGEGLDVVVFEAFVMDGVEDGGAEAVVAGEAFFGAEPEVAVAGLGDSVDGVLRKAGFVGEAGLDELRSSFGLRSCFGLRGCFGLGGCLGLSGRVGGCLQEGGRDEQAGGEETRGPVLAGAPGWGVAWLRRHWVPAWMIFLSCRWRPGLHSDGWVQKELSTAF